MNEPELRERIEYVENDPSASGWIKQAWETLKDRDPIDALNDVDILQSIVEAKWEAIKKQVDAGPRYTTGPAKVNGAVSSKVV